MPTPKRQPIKKRALTVRLPEDLMRLLEEESILDGRSRLSGRVYSPSATLQRILRSYFEAARRSRPKGRK